MAKISKIGIPKAPKPVSGKVPKFSPPKSAAITGGMKAYIDASKLTPNPKLLKSSQYTF